MRLTSFYAGDEIHIGAVSPEGIIDLTRLGFPGSMNDFIKGGNGMLSRVSGEIERGHHEAIPADIMRFANVTQPGKIICAGMNYHSHANELAGFVPGEPTFFCKFADTLCPSGSNVELPAIHRCYDYEAELVVVIGKTVWDVSVEETGDYIFGYTCGNDLSERESQNMTSQWLMGKSFPNFAPAGPYIVTADSFDPCADNVISCTRGDQCVQRSVTADMIFNCCELVSRASKYFKLEPGDLIFTGTPSGVIRGKPEDQRNWLVPGERVSVTIEGIGTLITEFV